MTGIDFFSGRRVAGILIAAVFALGIGCNKDVEPPTADGPNQKVVSYKVTGMTCSGCEGSLNKALVKLPHVDEVRASHTKNTVWLVVTGDAPSKEDVRDAVKKVGDQYEVDGGGDDVGNG